MGKAVIEDDSVEHVLLGDYMAIMGVMIETILSNRNVQDNIQTLNELNIPVRLVKLLSEAKKPQTVLLNSSYLPNLANILCCILRQTSKVDDAFSYLLERCSFELSAYSTEIECQQEKLFQLIRLSSLINTMNILMKSVIHAQGSYEWKRTDVGWNRDAIIQLQTNWTCLCVARKNVNRRRKRNEVRLLVPTHLEERRVRILFGR
ncbi:unnamed protein product [Meloidogyne enterolobii]|uniref:Uncharacterized protein n=1 Tax=Meloidogyne enterolobii TaxID=390850 RepID=A0ACB0YKT9_MELEN